MNASLLLPIREPGQAGEARRLVAQWGGDQGWAEELAGRVALIVTELGNNLALHTTAGGSLLLRPLAQENGARGVEILSLDSGPGVANFNECLRDGFSTAGTSGTGLGAVKRGSHLFAAHSQPEIGTALLSQIWGKKTPPAATASTSGAVNVAFGSEPVCGDSWSEQTARPGVLRLLVADGLGHGEFAAQASLAAVEVFAKNPHLSLEHLFDAMDGRLRATRGAAVAVAELDLGKRSVSFAGIGNIAATIVTQEKSTSLVSMNGTIGSHRRTCRVFTYPWPDDGILILASDGLKTQWRLDRYSGLFDRHPSLVAGILYRDYGRATDDITVLALRLPS